MPQYDFAASLVYEALAAGNLLWVGVADRGAGAFDDVVLGLRDRIVACQVKTSRPPGEVSLRTLLLGSDALLGRMLETRRKLATGQAGATVETVYACDDRARANDNVNAGAPRASSAALVRAHEAHRHSWTLADWRASEFAGLVGDLQAEAGLDDRAFEEAWRGMRFLAGGAGRALAQRCGGAADERRIRQIADLLPRLVEDAADQDRWSVAEVLSRLGWRDPFAPRHLHAFPVDALRQSNAPTEEALHRALAAAGSGYVSLVGPPGVGKSTLLAAGLLPAQGATVVRYTAFVPGEGQNLGRAEAFDFLHDLLKQLKQQGLGAGIVPGPDIAELRGQLQAALREAGERHRSGGPRTLVVIDGLDHVPREERPDRSFLRELPLPQTIPPGVVFLLGSQRLDLDDIAPAVRDQAREAGRCVRVEPLPRDAVKCLAHAAGVPDDVDLDELYERTAGHPLSIRYVVRGLVEATTSERRLAWLRDGPAYGGDVEVFYRKAWHDLEPHPDARRALAYVALAEGPILPTSLDRLVGSAATDTAWDAAGHLLVRDARHAWAVFHNSFRLYLQARTGLRHGAEDEAGVRGRYRELADLAREAGPGDPQRWMELRYRARAGDHAAVADLARPERFRAEFVEGRDPGDTRDDVAFAFAAAGTLRRATLVLELILSRHEIDLRADALGDEVFDAYMALGDHSAAQGLLAAQGTSLAITKGWDLVDGLLADGDGSAAREVFERLEPVDKLHGTKALELGMADGDVAGWAGRALVFREPRQVLAALSRLRAPGEGGAFGFDVEEYRTELKLVAIRSELARRPGLSLDGLAECLQVAAEHRGLLACMAAEVAHESGDDALTAERLEQVLPWAGDLSQSARRVLALAGARTGRLDLAAALFDGIAPPTLKDRSASDQASWLRRAAREVFTHAALSAWLGLPSANGAAPGRRLLSPLQDRLERLGRLMGEARAGRPPSLDVFREVRATLDLLQHAEGERAFDSERWLLDQVMPRVVEAMVNTAAAIGPEFLARTTRAIDERLAAGSGRLGRPEVRRAYALAAFRHDPDPDQAVARIAFGHDTARTPAEALAEAAQTAEAFAAVGRQDRARAVLAGMHAEGLGYSRAPKKDPQYLGWGDLFTRACDEDPAGRPGRLRTLGRLLAGMADTEGRNAAYRLAHGFLAQAAQAGPGWARAAAAHVEAAGLARWAVLVGGLLSGAAERTPTLAAAAALVFGRVALPFTTESDNGILPGLIIRAPNDQLEQVVRRAVACVEADSHPQKRVAFLREVVEAAGSRGLATDAGALDRWRAELPPKDDDAAKDPFAAVRSLDEFAAVLGTLGDRDAWTAVRAFERLAPESDYGALEGVFQTTPKLHEDERCIETVGRAALAAGRPDDAGTHLARLAALATDRGAWAAGWSGDAKQRYRRLDVLMRGEAARREAFDAFVGDLAHQRESPSWLLPDLGDVLELLSPRPSWAEAWAALERHLEHFREYRLGAEPALPTDGPATDERTIAEVLFRALATTTTALVRMARAAAVELVTVPIGAEVVAALLRRLWDAAGEHALHAAEIAWECRDCGAVRGAVMPLLPAMAFSGDAAVVRMAALLSREWGFETPTRRAELPAFYRLELPAVPEASRFEPPSGASAFSSGLWTTDPWTWTAPLEEVLGSLVRATGFEMHVLRLRVAAVMERLGGAEAFGPEAVDRQQRLHRRLGLATMFRRLLAATALRATREVVGELLAAGAIDPRAVPYILRNLGARAACIRTAPPVPRPPGVPGLTIADVGRRDGAAWQSQEAQDAVEPFVEGHVVLAATATWSRRYFQHYWSAEQYWGFAVPPSTAGLGQQLRELPRAAIMGTVLPLYDGLAQGAVVHPDPDVAGSIDEHVVMLCPRVAARLGWRSDPKDVFGYLDGDGREVARTLYWRDGGVHCEDVETVTRGQGHVLIARGEWAGELRPFLAKGQVARAWRTARVIGAE